MTLLADGLSAEAAVVRIRGLCQIYRIGDEQRGSGLVSMRRGQHWRAFLNIKTSHRQRRSTMACSHR